MNNKPKVVTASQIALVLFQIPLAYGFVTSIASGLSISSSGYETTKVYIIALLTSPLIFSPVISFIALMYKRAYGRWLSASIFAVFFLRAMFPGEPAVEILPHEQRAANITIGLYTFGLLYLIFMLIFAPTVRKYTENPNKTMQPNANASAD